MRSKFNVKAGYERQTPNAKREQFAALCREGKSREAIAGEMNIEIDTIREYARERGIPLPHSEYAVVRVPKPSRAEKPTRSAKILWDERLIHKLKQLWADPTLSASQIAQRLGVGSRNAVIGKVHRLGLPGRVARGGGGRKAPPPPSQEDLDAAALAAETAEAERLEKIARAREMAEARRQAKAAQIAQEAEAERLRLAAVVEQAPGLKASIDWVVAETAPLVEVPKVLQFSKIPAPVRKTPKTEPEPVRRGVSIFELNANTCRFPVGELNSEDFHFCGKQIVKAGDPDPRLNGREAKRNLPYCPSCCTVVYDKARGWKPKQTHRTNPTAARIFAAT